MNNSEILHRIEELKNKATKRPDTLVRISAGCYYFFSKLENMLLVVCDDSYENGGSPEWVVREDHDNNVVNEYKSLREFKADWVR